MTAKTIKTVCKIYDIIQVDKNNRYVLIDDWVLPKLKKEVPDFEGKYIAFRTSVPVILKTFAEPIIDGCSLSPDDLIIKTVIGAIAHDSGYQDLDALALAWADYGWSRDDCRRLIDEIFGGILEILVKQEKGVKRLGANCIARLYYTAVRRLGGIYNALMRALVIVGIGLIVGFSGCQLPQPFDNPDEFTLPNYDKVASAIKRNIIYEGRH